MLAASLHDGSGMYAPRPRSGTGVPVISYDEDQLSPSALIGVSETHTVLMPSAPGLMQRYAPVVPPTKSESPSARPRAEDREIGLAPAIILGTLGFIGVAAITAAIASYVLG